MDNPNIPRSPELPSDDQPKASEVTEENVAARFATLVDRTILSNIMNSDLVLKVDFNMNPPYEDTLRLEKSQLAVNSLYTFVVRRRQNVYPRRGYDAYLPEYIVKSIEMRDVQDDHVVKAQSFDLMINGVVVRRLLDDDPEKRLADSEGRGVGHRSDSASHEDISLLEDLLLGD